MFKDGRPGRTWYYGWRKRHGDHVTVRMPQKITKRQAEITKEDVFGWFQELHHYLESKEGGLEAISDPCRVFNADETGFALDAEPNQHEHQHQRTRELCCHGDKYVHITRV